MTRAEMQEKIRKAEAELKTAGPIHGRDLRKHIKRLKRELVIYDRYRAEAGKRPALDRL